MIILKVISTYMPKDRLKGVLSIAALGMAVAVSAFTLMDTVTLEETEAGTTFSLAPISLGNPAVASTLQTRQPGTAYYTENQQMASLSTSSSAPIEAIETIEAIAPLIIEPETRSVKLKSGGTLSGVLTGEGISNIEAAHIVAAFSEAFNPRKIKAGQVFNLKFMPELNNSPEQFIGLEFEPARTKLVKLERIQDHDGDGDSFKAWNEEKILTSTLRKSEGVITSSLYVAGVKSNLPLPVLSELIRAYSWDVDFQRSIRKNDEFSVLYEILQDANGDTVAYGKILYAKLTLSGDELPIYLFTLNDGTEDYFDATGKSAKKTLMRTPIDGARLSSSYGNRKHPTLGYNKLHTGVDFAAPRGTPIYAAGDGAIDYIGRKGGYGNYIRIRHNGEYSTAYAHMKGYASGMKSGKRVRQGQVIGYVGTTGRSTGPHLHYEIIKNGQKTNPMRVKMPSGKRLKDTELANFKEMILKSDAEYASAQNSNPSTVASAQ